MLVSFYHLACNAGYFGMKCAQQCYCRHETCINATGVCPTKGCQRGWQGDTCSDGKLKQSTLLKIISSVENDDYLYIHVFAYLYAWFCISFMVFPLKL